MKKWLKGIILAVPNSFLVEAATEVAPSISPVDFSRYKLCMRLHKEFPISSGITDLLIQFKYSC